MSLTPEQRAFRASGMGGTDVAELVLGSPTRLVAKKKHGIEGEANDSMLIGSCLEGGLGAIYAAKTGATLLGPAMVRHPKHQMAIGSLDNRSAERPVIEFKTANSFMRDQWGDESDAVPDRYNVQVQWYCGVVGATQADLAVLLGGSEFRIYTLAADPEFFGVLLQRAEQFWRDCIVGDRAPPVDGSEACEDALRARFPRETSPDIQANDHAEVIFDGYQRARTLREQAEADEGAARNALIAYIGSAAGVQGAGWRISYKATKPRNKTDWEMVARDALKHLPADEQLRLIKAFTAEKPGARVFRPTFKESNNG